MESAPRGLIVAAPSSGSGKTTVTLALLRYLANNGHRVSSFKVGPDYIDGKFHEAASHRVCRNIDAWAMRDETITTLIGDISDDAELVIGEGVMGVFDGAADGTGSTADVSAMTGFPIVLVVDVGGQAATAAAVVRGLSTWRRDVEVAGVVFNRVGGSSHAKMLEAAMADEAVPVLGTLPRCDELTLPDRHLGLVQAAEHDELGSFLDRAAEIVARHVDVGKLCSLAKPPVIGGDADLSPLPPIGQRIAVARDEAFSFAYPHVLEGWRRAGSDIAFFSPLGDAAPRGDADAVYLPGGYPELHAGLLAANSQFMAGLRDAAGRGAFVFGECGGYMALGDILIDAEGQRHRMAGLLALEASFAERKLQLGYRKVELVGDCPLGAKGTSFRGHEFHYASVIAEAGGDKLFEAEDALGASSTAVGGRRGSVAGSFLHLVDLA